MKISLSQNISQMRKANGMTQEQLAEALGVTFAAVSKWERGVATPEIDTIVQLADLFCVSVDALLGYRMRSNDLPSVVERLKAYSHSHDRDDDALLEAEKALKRFPNNFDVVYCSANLYSVRGLNENEQAYTHRALELYRHACRLIGQNTDDEISELSIQQRMATGYFAIGEAEKGLEILKKHNPCGLNNALIGEQLAGMCKKPDEALTYLSDALIDLTTSQMRITMGFLNYYDAKKDFVKADVLLEWALTFCRLLKPVNVTSYLDKMEAELWVLRAETQMQLLATEEAEKSLQAAKRLALAFDASPSYDANGIRFVSCKKPRTFYDSMGDSAMEGVERVLKDIANEQLSAMWEKMKHEKE